MLNLLEQEVQAVLNLDHKNIVKYYEFQKLGTLVKLSNNKTTPCAFLAMEAITGGELFDYIA